MDPAVRPQDDLWGHVNARWLATDPIPADRGRWGLSDLTRARVSEQLHEVVESACATGDLAEERLVARVRDLLVDEAGRAAAGLDPVRDELRAVDAIGDLPDLLRVLGERQREGMTGVLEAHLLPDADDPTRWAVHLFQAGLTLPVAPLYARLGDALDEHARSLCTAAGLRPGVAASAPDLERALAEVSWDAPDGEDDRALTHPMTFVELGDLAGIDLVPWLDALGLRPDRLGLNVCQPSYVAGLGRLLRERPLAQWQDYLRWRLVAARAAYLGPDLGPDLAQAHARFHEQVLGGQPRPTPDWRRRVQTVQDVLPLALGRLWVERYADERCRERTRELAEALRDGMRTTLRDCPWLGEEATTAALTKLDAVVMLVGWPDEWPDMTGLELGETAAGAVRAARAAAHDREVAATETAVDRATWGPPPYVVNTFYHPFHNQVTVEGASLPPAAVLDDPAVLFGQYASVLGHELGHAFDSRGSQRDHLGRVRQWWGAAEEAAFRERAAAVEAQVDGWRPRGVDDESVDGTRVGFECVAELIGLQLAWDAWCDNVSGDERTRRVDGLTGDERFFVAKAYGRRAADRPAVARARLRSDVHPPFEVFAGLVRNLDGFHETFATAPGDRAWLAPEERVRIF
nr:M13 family metallopeptidase [Arsenicicoccus dermatophilus]